VQASLVWRFSFLGIGVSLLVAGIREPGLFMVILGSAMVLLAGYLERWDFDRERDRIVCSRGFIVPVQSDEYLLSELRSVHVIQSQTSWAGSSVRSTGSRNRMAESLKRGFVAITIGLDGGVRRTLHRDSTRSYRRMARTAQNVADFAEVDLDEG